MAEAKRNININEPNHISFLSWFKEASFENFYQIFVDNELAEVSHIIVWTVEVSVPETRTVFCRV